MKVLGLLLWLVAFSLLACIVRQTMAPGSSSHEVLEPMPAGLLVIASSLPPQPAPEPAKPSAPACSRLGIFPRRDWAEHVATLLSEATFPGSGKPSSTVLPLVTKALSPAWRVQRIGLDAYYLQFEAWSLDELAARMTIQRDSLRGLLSHRSIPEPC